MEREDDDLPARIDRYEPLKKLATGGMAEIFLAKQSGLEGFEKVVVLKRILPHLASDDEFVSMFLDEARIAAKLSHPNVVQIYDLGKADATYYIAMEYVSGRNVQHLINKQQELGGHLPVEHVARIIAGVCDGLHYAHSRNDYDGKPLNIIHRDISPQNILVSFAGGVKVVDFGIAKASTQLAQTRAGVLKGKYAYMSPEQVRGAKIDGRSDLFAVGLVMYEMLTGVRAFERENSLKTLKAIVQEKPLNPRELNPEIPMEMVKLLSKALEKNPDRRYKSAQEMQLAIEDWLEASPKKSNNVRLSRFLYDLFDDELASAEGTMVVKGVGQVIIPTSQGKDAKPAVEDEIDSKTLTAALVDDAPETAPPKAKPSSRVRDEVGSQPRRSTPAVARAPEPDLDDDDDDDDGKTIPGYDLEQLERDRIAHMAKKANAMAGGNAGPVTGEEEEDEDKTRAGVPMSTPSMAPQPHLRESTRDRQRRPTSDSRSNPAADAHARAMLEKVDAIAPATLQGARPSPQAATASLPGEPLGSIPDGGPLPAPALSAMDDDVVGSGGPVGFSPPAASPFNQPFVASSSNARMDVPENVGQNALAERTPPVGNSAPLPRYDETSPGIDTPDDARMPMAAPKRPMAFFAMMGAGAVMGALGMVMFAVGALAFPAAVPMTEFGVVAINTSPPGATVTFENSELSTPGQVAIPLDGEARQVEINLPGFKPRTEAIVFTPGQNTAELKVTLEAQ